VADVARVAATLQPVDRRGSSAVLANGVRVIDDSYNASPAAVRVTVQALASTPCPGRRIAVLGEMRELGDDAVRWHEDCGRAVAEAHLDVLVAVGGPAADGLMTGAAAAGMSGGQLHRFATSQEAASAVAAMVRSGDVVLVKGSRGTRTDVIADRLKGVA
jgi:UDP-N-acetylmuramoyl-tripeptide--D-alanyl-D-alanine ligase